MAISIRYFVFADDGSLKHDPRRVSEGLHAGEDALPDFARSKQRVAEVVLDNEEGKPVRILDARGQYWSFDAEGRLDQSDRFTFMRWCDPIREAPKGKVVDLRPNIERKKWEREHRWDVSAEDLDRLTAAVWPWANGEPEGGVQSVKGKAQKVPPMTHDGEEAFSKIRRSIIDISMELERLSEPALKGVAYEARRVGRLYQGEQSFHDVVAAKADHHREIKARYRTGKGAWYADLQVWLWNEARDSSEVIEHIEERCNSKPAAIAAARRLLAENAHRFDANIIVEVEVLSELEWVPIKSRIDREDGED